MKYVLTFHGRQVGAIGDFGDFRVELEADSPEHAALKIYETHEHIGPELNSRVPNQGRLTITPKVAPTPTH